MNKLAVSMTNRERMLGWIYYAIQLLLLPELVILVLLMLGYTPTNLTVNLILFLINFLASVGIFRKFLSASAKEAIHSWKTCISYTGLGFLAYWMLNVLVYSLILNLYPGYFNLNNEAIGTMAQDHFLLLALSTVFLVPVAEELVFRGLIFSVLYNKHRYLAYWVSAAAFSAVHVVGYITDMELLHALMSFIQYLPAGLALGWSYAKSDTICTPILIHMCINLIGIFAVR